MKRSKLPKPLRWPVATAVALLLSQSPVHAQAPFVPDELEVCPASSRVYDPEFDTGSRQMVYYDGRGSVRVAPVLAEGRIGTVNCKGTKVARRATISVPGLPFKAGPEWALSARGLELYFTRLDRNGRPFLARAWFDGTWQTDTLPDSRDRGLALTSADAGDTAPRLVYVRSPEPGEYDLVWREVDGSQAETVLPGRVDPRTGGAPRWVPGMRALSYALPDASGTQQAVIVDVDTGITRYLTSDDGNKDEVWVWSAPEFGGDMVLMTVVDGCCLRFYRAQGTDWALYRELRADEFSRRANIFSPEPLVWQGRSYVVMQLAGQRTGNGGIWMVELAADGQAPLQLSDPERRDINRTEPEWYVGSDGVYVFITASEALGRFALNRLRTPLSVAR